MGKRSVWLMTAVAGGLLLLSGCFLAPHYRRPSTENPPAFKEQATPAGSPQWNVANPSDTLPRGPWWTIFNDPQLNQLEQKVLASNQNLKQAEAQYRQARAFVSEVRSAYFPTVSAAPSATRQLTPRISTSGNPNSGTPSTVNLFDLPLTASWEPDFWGAVTFAVRTAKAEAQASAAQLEGVRLSLQAELASDYFSMAAIDMETALLTSAIDSYQKALQLTQARFNGGVASNADVAQARTQLDTTRAQSTDLAITRAQLEHAIAVLVGQAPSTFSLPPIQIHSVPPTIPLGLPSLLLERRPDIATSERLIVAANGQIGLARAAYFPTFSLTATGGYESNTLADWITWPQRFWAIGASAAETLLDFGRRRAVSQQAQAAYDAQVAAYRQTVLGAFQEVEDNLAALRLLSQEAMQQDSATKAAEQSLQLELERYKAGIVSYLDIITVQNIALTNERATVQILSRRMTAAVTLIRALGGGWDISQLPWPDNFKSLPSASTAPVTSVGAPNPPAPSETSSSQGPTPISYGMMATQGIIPIAVSTNTLVVPIVISTGTSITPAAPPQQAP